MAVVFLRFLDDPRFSLCVCSVAGLITGYLLKTSCEKKPLPTKGGACSEAVSCFLEGRPGSLGHLDVWGPQCEMELELAGSLEVLHFADRFSHVFLM